MNAFPKIFRVGDYRVNHIFDGPVVVAEKVDGSQWGFGRQNGKPVFRSKSRVVYPETIDKMFAPALAHSQDVLSSFSNHNVEFYCETLCKPKHNILTYDRVPRNNLYLFAVTQDGLFLDIDSVSEIAGIIEVEPPNVLFDGETQQLDYIKSLVTTSVLGGTVMEGVVITNYTQPTIVNGRMLSVITTAKFVREEFKEKQSGGFKTGTTHTLDDFIESFKTEARWHKVVQHLRDNGELQHTPQDIGPLLRELVVDLELEEEGAIKEGLYKLFIRQIKRKALAGFPEWYKEQLNDTSD